MIVVDDGSPDEATLRIAIAPFRERIRLITQPNRGAGAARNAAIAAARGRWLAFLDADDCWHPAFLERQLEYLTIQSRLAMVYCDARLSGETALAGSRFMEGAPSTGEVTLLALIRQQCNVPLPTVVVRREVVVSAGLFDESLRRGQDIDLWLRLAARNVAIGYHADVLAERRVRAAGLPGDAVAELERAINVLDRFSHRHALPLAEATAARIRLMALIDRLEIEQARLRFVEGNFAAAQYHLNSARQRSARMTMARLALSIAPSLTRALYLRTRRSRQPIPQRTASAAN